MKYKQIRKGVFETNSSSTHSICVAKDCELSIPKSIFFKSGEFGWGIDTLSSVQKKASYLFTALHYMNMEDNIEKMVSMLTEEGIDVTLDEDRDGYIDHSSDLIDFISDVMGDKTKLLNYLFSDLSFVLTGNDNCDCDVKIDVNYPHDTYYKGN
jgi:hypothetical protein